MQMGHDSAVKRAALGFKRAKVMDDLRVIDMYEGSHST